VKKGTVLAQKIANITGKPVEAPTDKVRVSADGTYSVEHGGKMKTFYPENQKSDQNKQNSSPGASNSFRSSAPSAIASTPASQVLVANHLGYIQLNGAVGGGTAWGEQTSGGFVDAPGSNINLGGDNAPEPMSIMTAPR
jgi:hypothetical protein